MIDIELLFSTCPFRATINCLVYILYQNSRRWKVEPWAAWHGITLSIVFQVFQYLFLSFTNAVTKLSIFYHLHCVLNVLIILNFKEIVFPFLGTVSLCDILKFTYVSKNYFQFKSQYSLKFRLLFILRLFHVKYIVINAKSAIININLTKYIL